jgi:hypothetical protein
VFDDVPHRYDIEMAIRKGCIEKITGHDAMPEGLSGVASGPLGKLDASHFVMFGGGFQEEPRRAAHVEESPTGMLSGQAICLGAGTSDSLISLAYVVDVRFAGVVTLVIDPFESAPIWLSIDVDEGTRDAADYRPAVLYQDGLPFWRIAERAGPTTFSRRLKSRDGCCSAPALLGRPSRVHDALAPTIRGARRP